MEKQELLAVQELYNLIHNWREKYAVGWVNTSEQMKTFYRGVNHLIKSLQVLTRTEYLPCVTVEEKVANAVFYVEDGIQYKIDYRNNMDREFHVVDSEGNERDIDYYNRPANSYFLGTIRL